MSNDAAGIAALVDQLGLGAGDLLVMEASGGYERQPHRLLSARGLGVAIVSAARYATSPAPVAGSPRPIGSMPK